MSDSVNISPLKSKLANPGPILVVFGQRASVDDVAAALALYLSFKNQGKDVSIASPVELRAEFSRLVGLDEIGSSISNRDLVIGFPGYEFEHIEKVSHNEGSNSTFELIIQPKQGYKAPNPDSIKYSHRGAQAELVFTIGISRLEDLGNLYEAERKIFSETTLVAINRRAETNFAEFSIVDQQASSVSEIMMEFLNELDMPAKEDVASNLLAGIDYATQRFSHPQTSAQAFLTAGKLLQQGAKRQPPRMQMPDGGSLGNQPGSGFMPFVPPSSANRLPGSQPPQFSNQQTQPKQPPQEWLQPKIYKGGTQV